MSVIADSIETVAGDAPLAGMASGVSDVQALMLAELEAKGRVSMADLLEIAQRSWSNSITAMAFWGLVSHNEIALDGDLVAHLA